jgi:hypothetical protein
MGLNKERIDPRVVYKALDRLRQLRLRAFDLHEIVA